jgi:hypothetical protein
MVMARRSKFRPNGPKDAKQPEGKSMSQKFNPWFGTSRDTNAAVTMNELSDGELDEISGGGLKGVQWAHDDELSCTWQDV